MATILDPANNLLLYRDGALVRKRGNARTCRLAAVHPPLGDPAQVIAAKITQLPIT